MLLMYSGETLARSEASSGRVYAAPSATTAAEPSSTETDSTNETSSDTLGNGNSRAHTYRLYYRWDEIVVDTTYLDNRANIAEIVRGLHESPHIDSIAIYAYASPEGVLEHNDYLSKERAKAARRFILENLPNGSTLKKENIRLHPVAENWEGLREAVDTGYHRWDRDKVIAILDNPNISDATREWRLQQLDGGVSWKWMRIHLMPELRLATWICVWESVPLLPPLPELPVDIIDEKAYSEDDHIAMDEELALLNEYIGTNRLTAEKMQWKSRKYWYPALKTNLVYDVVTALNAEIEFPIGRHCSILVEDVFPWWSWGPNDKKYCFQLWTMGIEPRWWFKRDEKKDYLSGHFLGVYGMSGKYDFQWDTKICYQGEYWSAGLTYGYAMPVCRWMNMEFSISAGYLHSDYRHYQPDSAYEHLYRDRFKVGKISWWGPTKAKISLVIPIGKDSHNAKKSGGKSK